MIRVRSGRESPLNGSVRTRRLESTGAQERIGPALEGDLPGSVRRSAPGDQAPAGSSRLIRSRVYAVAVSYALSCVRAIPRYRVRLRPPIVFIQPNPSSINSRLRWLTA